MGLEDENKRGVISKKGMTALADAMERVQNPDNGLKYYRISNGYYDVCATYKGNVIGIMSSGRMRPALLLGMMVKIQHAAKTVTIVGFDVGGEDGRIVCVKDSNEKKWILPDYVEDICDLPITPAPDSLEELQAGVAAKAKAASGIAGVGTESRKI